MKLTCKKCGTSIEVPPEVKQAADPRVTCPQCGAGYRLRKGRRRDATSVHGAQTAAALTAASASGESTGSASASPTASAAPAARSSEEEAPTRLLPPTGAPLSGHPTPAESPAEPSVPVAAASGADSLYGLHSTPGGHGGLQAFQAETVLAERYRIVRFLAHGGMGEVYEAEDLELKERLALKTISPAAGATQDVATIDRFKREIALARAVTHPNVCRIFDLGQHSFAAPNGRRRKVTFLTMELLHGETLAARLRRRNRLSPDEALPLVHQMAAALDAAHAAKVVHRDFKSENVFLVPVDDRFRVVVTDFGVARGSDGADRFAAQVTGTGIVGTPSYMAPEQVEGKAVTPAADVYALGVVIYEMLTGCLPFEGPTPLSTAVKRLQEAPPTPRIHVPDLPESWEKTIMCCLERQPEDRFPSAGAVAASLNPATGSFAAGTSPGTGSFVGAAHSPETGQMSVYPGTPSHGMSGAMLPASTPAQAPTHYPSPHPTRSPPPHSTAVAAARPGDRLDHLATPPMTDGQAADRQATDGQATDRPTAAGSTGPTSAAVAKNPGRQRMLMAVLAVVLLVSAGLFVFNQLKNQDRRVAPRRSIAVLGFKNLTGQADSEWLATALTEMLATELGRGEALRSVSSDHVARIRQQLELDDVTSLEPEQLQRMRSLLACDFVVSGSYTRLGEGANGLRVDLRLRDAALGDAVASVSRQGAEADLFPMATELGNEVRAALGIGAAGEDALAGLPQDGEAARLYAEALELLRGSDPAAARQLLQQAVSREPTNALLHSALSSAWEAEGYRSRAVQAAERAFDLSSQLPQEDRLVVEGHVREMQGDWEAASKIYASLWEFFPDDLDYGLRLVAAENNARRPDLALAAIDRLRSLPAPLSEDPRIDLAEATSAALLADFQRQLQAADQGFRRAQALSAELLAAQAQIARSQALRRLGRLDAAAEAAQLAQTLYADLDHQAGVATAGTALANALADRGEFDQAARHYRQAIETHRGIGDQATVATGLNNLAMVLRQTGDVDSALGLYQEAAAIYQETDNRLGLANTENNLGVLLVSQDRLTDSMTRFEQARTVWEEHGDRAMQAYALNNIAAVAALQGDLWQSRTLHQQALDIRRDIGHKTSEVTSLTNLAGLYLDLGDLDGSQEHLDAARQKVEEVGDRAGRAEVLWQQARLDMAADRLPEARQGLEDAIALRLELAQERQADEARLLLARLLIEQGDGDGAEQLARQVVSHGRNEQHSGVTASALGVLARALNQQGRRQEAQSALAEGMLLAADIERRAVGLELELTAGWIQGPGRDATTTLRRLAELEEQIEAAGYGALRLEAAYVAGRVAALAGQPSQATQRLTTLEAEATGAGFALLARKAREAMPTG